jgi:hypothetical protein
MFLPLVQYAHLICRLLIALQNKPAPHNTRGTSYYHYGNLGMNKIENMAKGERSLTTGDYSTMQHIFTRPKATFLIEKNFRTVFNAL